MVVVVIASLGACLTLLMVIISERLCRQEIIEQGIRDGTQTIEAEVRNLRNSLSAVEQMATVQAKELLDRKTEIVKKDVEIAKLRAKLSGALDSTTP